MASSASKTEPGKGSTFWFTPPAGTCRRPFLWHARTSGSPRHFVFSQSTTTPLHRAILHEHILGWGMRNGSAGVWQPSARAIACRGSPRRRPYDVAILDMQMPGMDGLELAREIRAETPQLPRSELDRS